MNVVTINGIDYEVLGKVNTGKREYVFILNGDEVEYYKKTSDGYEKPSADLTLEGYAGKPLSELNENIVISHMLELMKENHKGE